MVWLLDQHQHRDGGGEILGRKCIRAWGIKFYMYNVEPEYSSMCMYLYYIHTYMRTHYYKLEQAKWVGRLDACLCKVQNPSIKTILIPCDRSAFAGSAWL